LGDPYFSRKGMVEQAVKGEDLPDGNREVGRADSTPSVGKPRTWGSGPQESARLGLNYWMNTQRGVYKMGAELSRIASKATRDRKCKFTSLVHLVNEKNLRQSFGRLKANKASGVDGMTKEVYGQGLDDRIKDLFQRLKTKTYRTKPVRRVYIPKAGSSEKRGLGIPAFEDKIVQMNVKGILESIFEVDFLDCSYGFRPGRGCHDAIKALNQCVMKKPINYVVEVDIRKFFDHVRRGWMMRCLQERIIDPNLLELIEGMLKAGVMEAGEVISSEQGTHQGNVISPVLSNIYLHYVLDLWFEKAFKPKGKGYMQMIRYCDDFVACFEGEQDAKEFLNQLQARFEKFGLSIAEEKTGLVKFGRKEWALANKQGRRSATFQFLGFTHYGHRSPKGYWVMGHKTSKTNLSRKLKEITGFAKGARSRLPLKEWWPLLKSKVAGHINYFGVSGNYRCLQQFIWRVTEIVFKWINRRSQKKSMNWEQYSRFLGFNPLPQARISHRLYQS
jgi:RNA-directed DNA polymerase